MTFFFDMDGTISSLYEVEGWLSMLIASDPTPYLVARPMVNLSRLARAINELRRAGHRAGIVSWLSKEATVEYDELVRAAKLEWLARHLPSVEWDEIHIVRYGTNKWEVCGQGILFDDEERNRNAWLNGLAYCPNEIFPVLNSWRRN